MTDFVKITDYAAKDALTTGNPAKLVKGAEIGADFDAVVVAVASKADTTSATLVTPNIGVATGTSLQAIIGNVTPAAITGTTITANTVFVGNLTGSATQLGGVAAAGYLQLAGGTMTGTLWSPSGSYYNSFAAATGSMNIGLVNFRSNKSTVAGGCCTYMVTDVEQHTWLGCGADPGTTGVKVDTAGLLTAVNGVTVKAAATGTSDGNVVSGTYTPTLSNQANVASISANGLWTYIRIGSVISVSGKITITATAGTTATAFYATLPVASNFGSTVQLSGVLTSYNAAGRAMGNMYSQSTEDKAWGLFTSINTNSMDMDVQFQYQVI